MKRLFILTPLLVVLLHSCTFPSPGVDSSLSSKTSSNDDYGSFSANDYIKASGNKLVNAKGEEIILKGVNLGGYLVIEQWMCAFKNSSSYSHLDHKTVTEIFLTRFSKEKTVELWQYYRDNFFTDYDFQLCSDLGMNVIRLPFTYMNVDPEYNNVPKIDGEKYNFQILDDFVYKASQFGIYTILDLHGAYGSQNGQDHSGEILTRDEVDFYSNEEKQSKTTDLWKALAKHFKGNPAVAGFDILNEPGEKAESTSERHFIYFDKVYDAIREIDKDRLVIFESCWDGVNLPNPSIYGWENCMYSFHNYSSITDDPTANLNNFITKLDGVENMNFNVPLYMGEFTCYSLKDSWKKVLDLLEARKWSYTPWTYKLNRINDTAYSGWAIFYSKGERVIPDEDSYEAIKDKFYKLDTAYIDTTYMTFIDNTTMYDLFKSYFNR